MKVVWASVVCLAFLPSFARGAIVYETAPDTNVLPDPIAGNSFSSYGDEINLGGTAREITSISIPFILQDFPGNDPSNSNYTPDLTLTLYQDNGTVTSASDTITNGYPALGGINRPGTVIASSHLIGPTFVPDATQNDEQTLTFTFPSVLVPSTFSFAVTQNNVTPDPPGLDITSIDNFSIEVSDEGGIAGPPQTPIIGTHNGFVWVQDANTGLFEATNYGFSGPGIPAVEATIVAVPEPSTLLLMAVAGLTGIVLLQQSRRRTKWSSE